METPHSYTRRKLGKVTHSYNGRRVGAVALLCGKEKWNDRLVIREGNLERCIVIQEVNLERSHYYTRKKIAGLGTAFFYILSASFF